MQPEIYDHLDHRLISKTSRLQIHVSRELQSILQVHVHHCRDHERRRQRPRVDCSKARNLWIENSLCPQSCQDLCRSYRYPFQSYEAIAPMTFSPHFQTPHPFHAPLQLRFPPLSKFPNPSPRQHSAYPALHSTSHSTKTKKNSQALIRDFKLHTLCSLPQHFLAE